MSLLRDHDTRREEEAVERHGLHAELLRPVPGEVGPDILSTTESRPADEADVAVLTDRGVRRKNRLVEVLARVVATRTTAGPLEDDREVWVGGSDVDNLADTVDGTRLERDMANAGVGQAFDDLGSLLGGRCTSGDTEALDGETLRAHLLPERELETKLAWVDVERVEGDTDASGDLALDLRDLGAQSGRGVMTSTGELDVVTGAKDSGDETSLDSGGRHAGNHNRGLAEQAGERSVDVNLAVAGMITSCVK